MIRVKRSTGKPVEYVLKSERDSDSPTVFLFRRLSAPERSRLQDQLLMVDGGEIVGYRQATVRYKTTLTRLCGWRNLKEETPNGSLVAVEYDENTKSEVYNWLPEDVRNELEEEFGMSALVNETVESE